MIDKEEYNKLINNEYNADKYCEDLPALFKYVKENDLVITEEWVVPDW